MPRVVYEPAMRDPGWIVFRWLGTVTGLLLAVPAVGLLIAIQQWNGASNASLVLPVMLLVVTAVIALYLLKAERDNPDTDAPTEMGRVLFGLAWLAVLGALLSGVMA